MATDAPLAPGRVMRGLFLHTDGRWYPLAFQRANHVAWGIGSLLFPPLAIFWAWEAHRCAQLTTIYTPCGHFYKVRYEHDGMGWLVPACTCAQRAVSR